MSGGMRQRVMIAMALVCEPAVLIADEPTTALDVTTQAQILALLNNLQKKLGTAVVMITHDLGVISETADHVIVMYAGKKVEEASVLDLFDNPKHPYTQGLMKAIPNLEEISKNSSKPRRLEEIKGIVPSLHDLPKVVLLRIDVLLLWKNVNMKVLILKKKHLVIGHPVLRNLINEYE